MSDESQTSDPKDVLLTDDGKWWEFLDDQFQVKKLAKPRVGEDVMDWSKAHGSKTRHGPVGFDFHERCAQCTQPLPPDLTFCFHCGGPPNRDMFPHPFVIVISELESERAGAMGAELLSDMGAFSKEEAAAILSQLPAAFFVHSPKKQLVALCGRLSDVGVYAKAYTRDRAPVSWVRETFESLARAPVRLATTVLGFAALVATGFFFWMSFVFAFAFVAAMLLWEAHLYRGRFRVDAFLALDQMSGFVGDRAIRARESVRQLRHKGVKNNVTIALMEYYALHQSLRGFQVDYGDMLDGIFRDLDALMSGVYGFAEKAISLERLPQPHLLEHKREQVVAAGSDKQIAAIDSKIDQAKRAEDLLEQIAAKIGQLTISLEALRARVAQLGTPQQPDVEFEEILAELDAELDLFSQTYVEVEAIAPA